MSVAEVTIFGGTGFLGHRIRDKMLEKGINVRVASRHPEKGSAPSRTPGRIIPVKTDILNPQAVKNAIDGADGVVNAVSLYIERGDATFKDIHVDGAGRIAETARKSGVERLVHLSGIGADKAASSPYVRSRGEGEDKVREAFEKATIFRPSAMFASDDAFLNRFIDLARMTPVLPLFGRGRNTIQPVFADDVAEAACAALTASAEPEPVYELGGPEIFTYRQFLETIVRSCGKTRMLMPVPPIIWDALAAVSQILSEPSLTEGQVALLKRDNIASASMPGLAALDVEETPIEVVLADIVRKNHRRISDVEYQSLPTQGDDG
jgi:uncharacterized protein YbjT (DUF2867 family)